MAISEETKHGLIIGLVICAILGSILMYHVAHIAGYRDALREIPLYYELRGEFPDEDWMLDAKGMTLESIEDIEAMFYPYGR